MRKSPQASLRGFVFTVHAKVWKKLYSTQEPHGFSHWEVQDLTSFAADASVLRTLVAK